ncbi:MAG: hypothetical protein Q7S72_00165 [Candidatus Taylorbacteria bacterium]|nr:hypothetical protein [Candidatus Taylorbacteria bacterium]
MNMNKPITDEDIDTEELAEKNDAFLPDSYKIPEKSQYMKLAVGENRIRVLSSPIMGWEWWEDTVREDGTKGRTPKRVHMDESVGEEHMESSKHFWSLLVWNYEQETLQIMHITQKTIQRALRALAKNKRWGNPRNYDIVIVRTGQDLQDTEYEVIPEPPTEADKKIKDAYAKTTVNLEALFEGKDPFEKV